MCKLPTAGMCVNMCKLPTQKFFTETFGLPLTSALPGPAFRPPACLPTRPPPYLPAPYGLPWHRVHPPKHLPGCPGSSWGHCPGTGGSQALATRWLGLRSCSHPNVRVLSWELVVNHGLAVPPSPLSLLTARWMPPPSPCCGLQ